MNSNVIEIVTILVQKLLHNEDLVGNEEEIIESLLNLGYSIRDIEVAFELIFSSAEIIGVSESFENSTYLPNSERILSAKERFTFSTESQSILMNLDQSGLLTMEEIEEILLKGASQHFEIGQKELWFLLKSVIHDKLRLSIIKGVVPGFRVIKDEFNFKVH